MKQIAIIAFATLFVVAYSVNKFMETYDPKLAKKVVTNHQAIQLAKDSLKYYKGQYKYYNDWEQLSYTMPVTKRHVRGKDLMKVKGLRQQYYFLSIKAQRKLEYLESDRSTIYNDK